MTDCPVSTVTKLLEHLSRTMTINLRRLRRELKLCEQC